MSNPIKEGFRSLRSVIEKHDRRAGSDPFTALDNGITDCVGFSLIMCALDAEAQLIRRTILHTPPGNDKQYFSGRHFMALHPILSAVSHMWTGHKPLLHWGDLNEKVGFPARLDAATWVMLKSLAQTSMTGAPLTPTYRNAPDELHPGATLSVKLTPLSPAAVLGDVAHGRTMEELSHAVNERIGRQP